MPPADLSAWITLRELDESLGRDKGYAFRLFKRSLPQLREAVDYRVLSPQQDADEIERLRSAGRSYRGSVNVVLLSADCARRLRAAC